MDWIHIMSTGGGTGKTSVSISLARAIARQRGGSVLILDADFMGPSIREEIEPWGKEWGGCPSLTDLLLCPGDEYHSKLEKHLPVYCARESPLESMVFPNPLQKCYRPTPVLFSPSSVIDTFPKKETHRNITQLHTMLAYERTGGGIASAFKGIAKKTNEILTEEHNSSLTAVIVDHSSGIGPLQWEAIRSEDADVRIVFVGDEHTATSDINATQLIRSVPSPRHSVFVANKVSDGTGYATRALRVLPGCVRIWDYSSDDGDEYEKLKASLEEVIAKLALPPKPKTRKRRAT